MRADAELLDRVAENAPQRADVIAQKVHIPGPVKVSRGRQDKIGIVHVVARVHRGEDAQDGDFAGTRVAEADAQSRDVVAAQSQLVDRHIHVNGHTGGGIGGDFERDLARFGKAGRRRPPLHVGLQRRCARNELDANPGRRLGIDIDRRRSHGGIVAGQLEPQTAGRIKTRRGGPAKSPVRHARRRIHAGFGSVGQSRAGAENPPGSARLRVQGERPAFAVAESLMLMG